MKNMLIEDLETMMKMIDEMEQICERIKKSFIAYVSDEFVSDELNFVVECYSPSQKIPIPPPPPLSYLKNRKSCNDITIKFSDSNK